MSAPNQRLDSISRPSSTGPSSSPQSGLNKKPGLKFKPKVVARKTKEERDSSAPINTPGVNKKPNGPQRPLPKPGQRGLPRHLQNTKIVTSGPLSSGAVSLGGTVGPSMARSSSPSLFNNLSQKLRSQTPEAKKGPGKIYDDDDDDFVADENTAHINMSEAYSWDEVDTEMFPVRAARTQHREYGEDPIPDTTIKTEFHREASVPPVSDSEPNSRAGSVPPVKQEEDDELKPQIPDLISDMSASQPENVNTLNDYQINQESIRLLEDYESILTFLKACGIDKAEEVNKDDENAVSETSGSKLLFIQLPEHLPAFESVSKPSEEEPTTVVKREIDGDQAMEEAPQAPQPQEVATKGGVVGKLRYHKSGKVTIKLGNIVMDVTRGGASQLTQSIVAVNNESKRCVHLGHVDEKIIATPKFA